MAACQFYLFYWTSAQSSSHTLCFFVFHSVRFPFALNIIEKWRQCTKNLLSFIQMDIMVELPWTIDKLMLICKRFFKCSAFHFLFIFSSYDDEYDHNNNVIFNRVTTNVDKMNTKTHACITQNCEHLIIVIIMTFFRTGFGLSFA